MKKKLRQIIVEDVPYNWSISKYNCDGDGGFMLKIWGDKHTLIHSQLRHDDSIRPGDVADIIKKKVIKKLKSMNDTFIETLLSDPRTISKRFSGSNKLADCFVWLTNTQQFDRFDLIDIAYNLGQMILVLSYDKTQSANYTISSTDIDLIYFNYNYPMAKREGFAIVKAGTNTALKYVVIRMS